MTCLIMILFQSPLGLKLEIHLVLIFYLFEILSVLPHELSIMDEDNGNLLSHGLVFFFLLNSIGLLNFIPKIMRMINHLEMEKSSLLSDQKRH